MSISDNYIKYLEHFKHTTTILDFAESSQVTNLRALRHDVDHSLDIALEMAYVEHKHGFKSTYYLLDTAEYWNQSDFHDKCLQITDFGHEVGLHINLLAKWSQGTIDNIYDDLLKTINTFQSKDITIKSISTHGDPLCYSEQFINYWCFKELRPADPTKTESGLSAEGIAVTDQRFQIIYPESHSYTRADGKTFQFWTIPMKELGIAYDAMHIPFDRYYSDSGGWWTRTADPINEEMDSGRIQLLMHPEYWKGERKIYFFLSTPRSGSTWLADFLNKATPVSGRHEFTLNHYYKGEQLVENKQTYQNMNYLLNSREEVNSLFEDSRLYIEQNENAYAEANVYLHYFISELSHYFPEASFILLHRNPADVVRSLINRDWYDTPEDYIHPAIEMDNWDDMTQFEKCCAFVSEVNLRLLNCCENRISFETMTQKPDEFIKEIEALGIPVYSRLAKPLFSSVKNANKRDDFPRFEEWTSEQKQSFINICGSVCKQLTYFQDEPLINEIARQETVTRKKQKVVSKILNLDCKTDLRLSHNIFSKESIVSLFKSIEKSVLLKRVIKSTTYTYLYPDINKIINLLCTSCLTRLDKEGLAITNVSGIHTNVIINGDSWKYCKEGKGWQPSIGGWYKGTISVMLADNAEVSLLCLMYDKSGELFDKRVLVRLTPGSNKREFSFSTRINVTRFCLALYRPASEEESSFTLQSMMLEEMSLQTLQ